MQPSEVDHALEKLEQTYAPFLMDAHATPFGALVEISRLASTSVANDSCLPYIFWSTKGNFTELTLADSCETVKLHHISHLASSIMKKIENEIAMLTHGISLDVILGISNNSYLALYDEPNNTTIGYSFVYDECNDLHSHYHMFVGHVHTSPDEIISFVTSSTLVIRHGEPVSPDVLRDSTLADLQAGHSSEVAGRFYSRSDQDPRHLDATTAFEYYHLSAKWQDLLGVGPGIYDFSAVTEAMRTAASKQDLAVAAYHRENQAICERVALLQFQQQLSIENTVRRLVNTPPAPDLSLDCTDVADNNVGLQALEALRLSLNAPMASFKSSAQAVAIQHALLGQNDLLVAFPTGGGKTSVYLAPLMKENQTTVLVLPLVALAADVIKRVKDLNVSCGEYTNSMSAVQHLPRLLLVSIKQAATSRFAAFLRLAHSSGKISRVVLDEAHLAVQSADYRQSMHQLLWLRTVQVPLICLTATLPVSMEKELSICLGTSFNVIRACTVRENLKYIIEDAGNDKRKATLKWMTEALNAPNDSCIKTIFVSLFLV
ncbi:hypothetical protein BDB00DRAFT_891912 [Zychaea mexicana]|uniref:uncharacterized protein n=1 Tax=Zychaea mexicana TaxID=64656 RepID=UPI0022FDC208|nr:uncharacterized protein BDB00DRAFT_891912 [Zychaea mexicana]KAI9484783.1 hypothetical protein BDB00DRAFT_891912 [Zychaea mexicana]